MESWLGFLVIVAAVASRPIEVRLWRAGRMSDRQLALLLLGRFPIVVGVFAALSGGPMALTVLVIAISLVPVVVFYPIVLGFISQQRRR